MERYLRFGGPPAILNSEEPREDLAAYVQNYLNEEIKLEANIRKIDYFHRFLEAAALGSTEILNYLNVARDTGVMHTILRPAQTLDRNPDLCGKSFEQFLAQEIRAYISYRRLDIPMNF